jgi:predicted transcriptional regulator of viral defense system
LRENGTIPPAVVLWWNLHVQREKKTFMRTELLLFLDQTAAHGGDTVTAASVRRELGLSAQSASNLLGRAVRDGMLDRVASGTYVLRPIGMLGTRAASEDVSLAVAAKFGGEPHRLAYRSALDHHGLLVHPARVVQVALPRRVKVAKLSGRRLQTFVEPAGAVGVGSEAAGRGASVSSVERALLESADRPRLVGGWAVVAGAIGRGTWDPERLGDLAQRLDMGVALRRVGSIAEQVGRADAAAALPAPPRDKREVALDPREEMEEPWLDKRWRVRWPVGPQHATELVQA